MIDPSLIPGPIREMVLGAEDYSEAEWKRVTSGWLPFYRQLALGARRYGEKGRGKMLSDGGVKRLEKEFDFEEDMDLTLTLFCLSDKSLDKAIATFRSR